MEKQKEKSVAEIVEEVKSGICDHYCRFPFEYLDKYGSGNEVYDRMIEEVCAECPLNRL